MRKLLVLALLSGCGGGPDAVSFKVTCAAGTPSADALIPAGRQSDGSVILPDGRKLTPAGNLLGIGGFPVNLRILPQDNGRYVVTSDADYGDEHLRIIDTQATGDPVVSNVDYLTTTSSSHDPALWYGLAVTQDGSKLYVSDGAYDPIPDSEMDPSKHYNVIEEFDLVGDPPMLQKNDALEIHLFNNGTSARLPAGMVLSADDKTLYVVTQLDGTLAIVDLTPGAGYGVEIGRTPSFGIDPYDLAVDESAHLAYVSLWGGVYLGPNMFNDGVQAVDLSNPAAPMPTGALIPTAKASEGIALIGGKLYVTDTDGDAVTTYDPASMSAVNTPTALDGSGLFGSSPSGMAVDGARNRLYVANAGENAVQAFDLGSMKSLGRIPTAWYPTAVAVEADGTLLVTTAKGLGAGPSDHAPGKDDYMQGTLQVVPPPADADLQMGDATVMANLTRPKSYEVALTCTGSDKAFTLPADRGGKTPIEHVFLIVRENKTYDAVLGDLPGANGEPSLALFGGDTTPNLHALAARFANLDNFYSLAEQSLQGHEWTTTNASNDYTEKGWLTTWGRATRPLGAFSAAENLGHLTLPAHPTVWGMLDAANLSYHNYGEIVNSSEAIHTYDVNYPGVFFNTAVKDVDKIAYVIGNLQDKTFSLERFSYISLPNDHTVGTTPGKPTPQSMIADNDEATGRFVDALSHSNYWPRSALFLIEDDPQDGGDHVEIHRSPCLVISPWAKAGYTSSVHYDVPAMYKTISLLLGTPPINQRDANAAAFYDVFATKADTRPYTFIPRKVAEDLNGQDAPLGEESSRIDFSQPDQAPLGRILWKAVHGKGAEPPWGSKPLVRDDDD
jgi:DNA-binding beta-propeller fold protein YncE